MRFPQEQAEASDVTATEGSAGDNSKRKPKRPS